MFEPGEKEHPPCGNVAAARYRVRLSAVLGRFEGWPLKEMYGVDPAVGDGVDPGCLDAPDWMPAGGMKSPLKLFPRYRDQMEWRREYWLCMN